MKAPEYPIHGSMWFDVREWVDERVWKSRGIKSAELIDPKIIRIADLLREKSGVPVTVNNWFFARAGETVYKSSGFRAVWDRTGGQLSQHRCGRAGDFKVRGFSPAQVHRLILTNTIEFEAFGLTTLEDLKFTPSWSHLDCRAKVPGVHPETGMLIVRP